MNITLERQINKCLKEWGGHPEDYRAIHEWVDQVDRFTDPQKGRYLLHHCMGPFIAEQVFGVYIVNSDNKKVPVKSIVEEHIKIEFNGHIPTVAMWLDSMEFAPWMMGGTKEEPNKKVFQSVL